MAGWDPKVEKYVDAMAPDLRPIGRVLVAVVRRRAPGLTERIYMGMPNWFAESAVLYLADYGHHMNLGFWQGATVSDPAHLLQGTGKRLRHVKIRTPQDARSPQLGTLISRAAREAVRDAGVYARGQGSPSRARVN